ncbi:MAG: hypothetical protein JO363_15520, partial [Solirubrobacterales bacterium]|nr:hypothetical protein [Solirubrobacterales bacterium]
DIHWADASTLLLLRHLARTRWTGAVLVFATFRDTEPDMPELLSQTLADLRRSDDVVRLRLGGLSRDEVGELVRRAVESDAETDLGELAGTISDLTGGNAFLVCELWRALLETGAVEVEHRAVKVTRPVARLGTPESVREVVSERLARLAPATTTLLELSAAAGAEFELEVVRRGSALEEDEFVAALDEAIRSAMIEQLPGRRLAYRFTHELVRRGVYDRLTAGRKAQLHLRVGEAMETERGRSPRALADLAHHFAAAAPLGDVGRAIDYNVLAARAAVQSLAFDEAAELLETALDLGIDDDAARRAQVLLDLGTARHLGGKAVDAMEAFRAAGDIARTIGDPQLLAQAAIGYEEASWRPGLHDLAVGPFEEALATLGDDQPQLRLALLSGLGRALDLQGQHERAAVVRNSAVALGRELDDRLGVATVLLRSYWARGATPDEEILEMLTEAKTMGEELANTEIQAEASVYLVPTFVALTDMASARREVSALRELAQRTGQPFILHVAEHYGAAIALGDGRLGAAEAMASASEEAARLLTGRDASGTHGIQMFSLRREQGRLAQLAPVIRILAAREREHGPWRPGLASLLAELGMVAEAKRELKRIAAEGIEPLRQLWLASLTYITDACSAVGDEETAALIYPALESLSGKNVMIGNLVMCYGAADRYLGMLARTLGEWERAEQHFERAIELNRQMGAATWLAHTQYEYARLILASRPHHRRL